MIFFDYIFCKISNIYIKTGLETSDPQYFSGSIVSLFQMFNILTIVSYFFRVEITKSLFMYIGIPLIILNLIFVFNGTRLHKLQDKWHNEKKIIQYIKGGGIIIYMIISIVLFGLV